VTLAVEEIKLVAVARSDADLEGIQADGLRELGMKGTQINDQTIVDVYPHIIITSEFENLTSGVSKSEVSLETVSVIVVLSSTVGAVVFPTNVIKGEERVVGVFVDSRSNASEGQVEDGVPGLLRVVEPVVEGFGRLDVLPGTYSRVCIYRCSVSPNRSTLAGAPAIQVVTLLAHQTFLIVGIVTKWQLEVCSNPTIRSVGFSGRTAQLHPV